MNALDLSKPSVEAARELAKRHMAANGNSNTAGAKEFVKLLWLVPYAQGGFAHGDDRQVKDRAKRMGLSVFVGLPTLGAWPKSETTQQAKAA